MQMAREDPARYKAALAAAKAGASLVVEEQRQAKAAQQAKQQRKSKKARQKQRKQVDGCSAAACTCKGMQHDNAMHVIRGRVM